MPNQFPIRAVAKITGLSLDTLRSWERRYRAVVPERSARGRQYDATDIERLSLLAQLVRKGHSIGGIAPLGDADLQALLQRRTANPAPAFPLSTDLFAHILLAIEDFDSARAGDELSRLAAMLNPRDLVYKVALPLMREVGFRWHEGTLSTAQEHLVSQLLRNLMGNMVRLFRPAQPAMKMVMATPAGESHEFGILAAAMLTSAIGIEVVYLGADLPASEIVDAARHVSARVILLGITIISGTTAEEVRAITASMPEDCKLWLGGEASMGLDRSDLPRQTLVIKSLLDFENECLHLGV